VVPLDAAADEWRRKPETEDQPMLIRRGRLEVYAGRQRQLESLWDAGRISDGWGLWLGRWTLLACWLRKRLSDAELEAKVAEAAARIGLDKE
jgi:hypothetical protein